MKVKIILFALFISIAAIACGNNNEEEQKQLAADGNHKVEVLEVIQANSYTYLRVDEFGKEVWMAVSKMEAKEGDVLYYKDGFEMKDFPSKDLDRTFESILFVQAVSPTPFQPAGGQPQDVKSAHSKIKPEVKTDIKIEKVEGGVSIAELYADKNSFSGKSVKIKGQVTKVNLGIMGRNWFHIQDGSSTESYDLTVTTDREAVVGDVVTFEGIITVNKDFGSGYSYEIIMEEAKLLSSSKI